MTNGEYSESAKITAREVLSARSFSKCDTDTLLSDLHSIPWRMCEASDCLDYELNCWKVLLLEVVDKHVLLSWTDKFLWSLIRSCNY